MWSTVSCRSFSSRSRKFHVYLWMKVMRQVDHRWTLRHCFWRMFRDVSFERRNLYVSSGSGSVCPVSQSSRRSIDRRRKTKWGTLNQQRNEMLWSLLFLSHSLLKAFNCWPLNRKITLNNSVNSLIFAMHPDNIQPSCSRQMLHGVLITVYLHVHPSHHAASSPNFEENCFVTVSTAGVLNIWDVQRLVMVSQSKIHNGTINRIQFHPKSKSSIQNVQFSLSPCLCGLIRSQPVTHRFTRWLRQGNMRDFG